MLTAELNCGYWQRLGQRYAKREKAVKIFLAVVTSTTVASWGLWQHIDLVWKGLSGGAAVLAIAFPLFRWDTALKRSFELHGKWLQRFFEYERIWIEAHRKGADINALRDGYFTIRKSEAELAEGAVGLPHDAKLIRQTYDAILRRRRQKR